uniref:ETS variant transcription factor 2 n=1 Tax=Ursus americanus TaxID=9643 RepID=A0A452S3Z8_URSAM
MDFWNWDEASPQEVPPGNRLSGLEGAELGFYFPELALPGDTRTGEPRWKGGLPQPDWDSALPHPEAPWGPEPAPQALPWSGDWTDLECTGSDPWSGVSQALGPAPPGLGPAPFVGAAGAAGQNCIISGGETNPLYHLLGLGAAYGLHHLFKGVPDFRSHHVLRTEPAVGRRNLGLLPQK